MKPTISAFVPCTRPDRMIEALDDAMAQSVPIDSIIVVDNKPENRLYHHKPESWWRDRYPNVSIIVSEINIGTNAVWNMGLRSHADYILYFPYDMRFDPHFTKKAIYTFKDERVGIVSAKIILWEESLPKGVDESYKCGRVAGHGKAGVFMIRGELARKMPLIPSALFIFFGDDWLDLHCRFEFKKLWVELKESCARHEYGSGVSATLKKSVLKEERVYWYEILKEKGFIIFPQMRFTDHSVKRECLPKKPVMIRTAPTQHQRPARIIL